MTYREATPAATISPAPNGLVRYVFSQGLGHTSIVARSWFAARAQLCIETGAHPDGVLCIGRDDVPADGSDVIAVEDRWRAFDGIVDEEGEDG